MRKIKLYGMVIFALIVIISFSSLRAKQEYTYIENLPKDALDRIGVSFDQMNTDYTKFGEDFIRNYPETEIKWYYDFGLPTKEMCNENIEYRYAMLWQIVSDDIIREIITNCPNITFIVGNEPFQMGQQNLSAQQYARFYHENYTQIKNINSKVPVAIAAMANMNNDNMNYLNRVFSEYTSIFGSPMPIDVFTIHSYYFHPTFFNGLVFTIERMRNLMNDNGYRNRSLIVTEFIGDEQFMRDAYLWMLTVKDNNVGLESDNNRLVQGMSWFCFNKARDIQYYYMFEKDTKLPTALYLHFTEMMNDIEYSLYLDSMPTNTSTPIPTIISTEEPLQIETSTPVNTSFSTTTPTFTPTVTPTEDYNVFQLYYIPYMVKND